MVSLFEYDGERDTGKILSLRKRDEGPCCMTRFTLHFLQHLYETDRNTEKVD